MMRIVLYTSGTTKEPKLIEHSDMLTHVKRSVNEIDLKSYDTVLDVFPANVIAHYTVTAQPAIYASARLITSSFEPYNYIRLFRRFSPSVISLIPRHIEILEKTKEWNDLDMGCVRYMITGSQPVSQSMIDSLRSKGVQTVANWYGMTEMPPPVLIGYNSECFDFEPKDGYDLEFSNEGECIINGIYTNDIFDIKTKKFLKRKVNGNTNNTWKTSPSI